MTCLSQHRWTHSGVEYEVNNFRQLSRADLNPDLFVTRQFIEGAVVYAFVTGTSRHGHSGAVVLVGPHAAEFSERFRRRLVGGPRYHA